MSPNQKPSISSGIVLFILVGLLSAIIYIYTLGYFFQLDDVGINAAANSGYLTYVVLPTKFFEFSLVGTISFFITRIFQKLPKILFYLLPILLIALVFFLELDFYHWTMRDYPLGYNGDYINRSFFWTHILK